MFLETTLILLVTGHTFGKFSDFYFMIFANLTFVLSWNILQNLFISVLACLPLPPYPKSCCITCLKIFSFAKYPSNPPITQDDEFERIIEKQERVTNEDLESMDITENTGKHLKDHRREKKSASKVTLRRGSRTIASGGREKIKLKIKLQKQHTFIQREKLAKLPTSSNQGPPTVL